MYNFGMKIIQDTDKAIEVMHGIGVWMEENNMHPSEYFQSKNMNSDYLLKRSEPSEYYVALVDESPAASMILQETERNQSWKSVDGENPKKALYVHWLCVSRAFAGQGFSNKMIDFAVEEARKRGFQLLRLDTNADEKKLCALYEKLGFQLMGMENEEGHTTAFYQMGV
jgi:ribosomal protein S18 acetylase RimI-like enzyme